MAAPSSIPPFPDEGGGSASNIPPFPDEAAPSPKPPSLGTKPGATFTIQHPLPERAERPEAKDLILRELTDIPKSLLSLADMVGSIPASLVGTAADAGFRVKGMLDGDSHRWVSREGQIAAQTAMEVYGNPFSKLLHLAGIGKDGEMSTVDGVMDRATKLLEKGGDWLDKHTDGAVNSDDTKSIVDAAMAVAGGKGLEVGVRKLARGKFTDATLAGAKLNAEALERIQRMKVQKSPDPTAPAKVAEAKVGVAQEAVEAKTRLQEGKTLEFDPIKQTFSERVEPGMELPKPTSLESGLEKAANGKLFDLTAEERIALKGLKDAPLERPIVDESGKILRGGGKLNPEAGAVDPKLLARMAAVGLGAWAGYQYSDDHDFESAVLGAAGGFLGAKYAGKAVEVAKKAFGPDTRIKINEIPDAYEKYTEMEGVEVWAEQKKIEKLVPDEKRLEAITHAIEAKDLSQLSPKERQAAKIATDYLTRKGGEAQLSGVLHSGLEDYVPHVWDWSKNKGLFEKWMGSRGGSGGMSGKSGFAKERTIPTIAEGKAAGLTPLTENISHLIGIYGNSMSRSIGNSVLLKALRQDVDPATGKSLVMPAEAAPHSYVSLNNASMRGLAVHPDIAPSLKMLYDTSSPGAAMKIIAGLSDTTKRTAVSFSLFHAKALTDALIAGSSNPAKALAHLPGFIAGTDAYLQELLKGSASPLVERALEGGLMFALEGEGAGVADAGEGFYGAMTAVQQGMDSLIPHGGLPIKAIVEMNHKVDTLMWSRLHAGMKLMTFAEKYQLLLDNAAKKKGSTLSPDQASRIAASYTNDLFGGLNWRRVAEDARTRFGRELGQATLNPGARRILSIMAFAPDWTLSTTRAMAQAFGKPDFLRPTTLAGLHQQYLLRAATYYLLVGEAINYTMSGHHLWDNKDPTVLDMDEKGERHMQWSKHTMEPLHWVMKPGQQALNKLGMIPKELASQTLGVEYLSAKGRMPPMKGRVSHLAKNFVPIGVQNASTGGVGAGVASFAGVPIYGKTGAEKKAEKAKRVAPMSQAERDRKAEERRKKREQRK